MVFVNTNALSEATKVSAIFLKFLLSIPAVTFEKENFSFQYLFYGLGLTAVKQTE